MNRAVARAAYLGRVADQHYRLPHTRIIDDCEPCSFYVMHYTLALSRQWAPKRDVRRFFVTPNSFRTPVVQR